LGSGGGGPSASSVAGAGARTGVFLEGIAIIYDTISRLRYASECDYGSVTSQYCVRIRKIYKVQLEVTVQHKNCRVPVWSPKFVSRRCST